MSQRQVKRAPASTHQHGFGPLAHVIQVGDVEEAEASVDGRCCGVHIAPEPRCRREEIRRQSQ